MTTEVAISFVQKLGQGSKVVTLTPDDILTLRLLRDDYAQERIYHQHRTFYELDPILETLERILKQVG